MQDVRYECVALWVQTAVYFMLSLFIYERMYRSDKMPRVEFVLAMRTRVRKDLREVKRDLKAVRSHLKK